MIIFAVLFVGICVCGFILAGFVWFVRRSNDRWNVWSWRSRIGFLAMGALVISSPYVAFKIVELRFVLARVPGPLRVSWIDYRVEEASGIGMPGDNETGFVVYRLTGGSARWALDEGERLGMSLSGGAYVWHQTPIDHQANGGRDWHPRHHDQATPARDADINEYLDKYGFGIRIDRKYADAFNQTIARSGSFYAYGRGGSLVVVDPRHRKLYYAYAG